MKLNKILTTCDHPRGVMRYGVALIRKNATNVNYKHRGRWMVYGCAMSKKWKPQLVECMNTSFATKEQAMQEVRRLERRKEEQL